jgi:hypothetical protein
MYTRNGASITRHVHTDGDIHRDGDGGDVTLYLGLNVTDTAAGSTTDIRIVNKLKAAECDFWDSFEGGMH